MLTGLGCLPLAERGLRLGQPRRILLSVGIFGAAMAFVIDPFLMAVTVGTSSAFLTPIGHQSNTTPAPRREKQSLSDRWRAE